MGRGVRINGFGWRIAWIAVLGLAVILRIYASQVTPVSRDECFTWRLIQYDCTEIVKKTADDVHPPFYYLVGRGFAQITGEQSIGSLRLLSALISIATGVLIYGVFRHEHLSDSVKRGVFASAIFLLHDTAISTSIDARMYSLTISLAWLSSWFCLVIAKGGQSNFCYGFCYVVSMTLLLYTHYFALLLYVAHMAYHGWLQVRKRRIGVAFWASAAFVGILFTPWLHVLATQVRTVSRGYWIPPTALSEVGRDAVEILLGGSSFTHFEAVAVLAIVARGVYRSLRSQHAPAPFWLFTFALPWLISAVMTFILPFSIYQPRYLAFTSVGAVGLIVDGVFRFDRRWACYCVGCLFLAYCFSASVDRLSRPAVATIADVPKHMFREYRRGDYVLVTSPRELNRIKYHMRELGMDDTRVVCRLKEDDSRHVVHVASFLPSDFRSTKELQKARGRWWVVSFGDGVPIVWRGESPQIGWQRFSYFDLMNTQRECRVGLFVRSQEVTHSR